jgi:general L-amino acid transport system substrate-binding protein
LKVATPVIRLTLALMLIGLLAAIPMNAQDENEPTPAPTATPSGAPVGATLSSVLSRGEIICAVDQDLIGFGYLNPNTGEITGISVDLCRAIATSIFGDSGAAQIFLLANQNPFDLLSSGAVDIVISSRVSHTLSGDADSGLQFGAVAYYDGQTFMVTGESGIDTWEELEGATICSVSDTIAERNLIRELERREINFDLLSLPNANDMQQAFLAGRCGVQTGQRSQLEITRQRLDEPAAYMVWQETFTRDAITPLYRYGDKQWSDIINWTIYGLIYAESLGITSENVDELLRERTPDFIELEEDYIERVGPEIARFLDGSIGIGNQLGLANDFMVEVIRQVGNYGEILQRHLGENGQLPIARAINSLWLDGGLIFAPDWR